MNVKHFLCVNFVNQSIKIKKPFKFPSILLTENYFLRTFFRGPFRRGPFFRGLLTGDFFPGDLFSRETFFRKLFVRGFFSRRPFFGDHSSGDRFSGTFFAYPIPRTLNCGKTVSAGICSEDLFSGNLLFRGFFSGTFLEDIFF